MPRQIRHRNTNSIWLYDFNQFQAFNPDRDRILFLSMKDMNLIWNAIQNISLLQSRVYTDVEGQVYTVVEDEDFETFQGYVSDLRNHLGEYLVTNEILAEMLTQLTILANKPCCSTGGSGVFNSGSRGAGVGQATPNPYSEASSPPETPPPGFDTWEEYRQHKCDAASDLIKNLKTDLLSISNLMPDLEGATWTVIITAILAVLLSPIPYDDLALLVSTLITAAFAYSFLAQLSTEIQDNAENLICTLYNSDSAEDGKSALISDLEELIDGMDVSPEGVKDWLKDVIGPMVTYDSVNRLFVDGPTESAGADCSACGPGALYAVVTYGGCTPEILEGSFLPSEETQFESCTTSIYGDTRANSLLVSTETNVNKRVEITSASGANTGMYLDWYDNGVHQTSIPFTTLSDLIGEIFDASSLHFSRFDIDDTNAYSLTVVVTEVP